MQTVKENSTENDLFERCHRTLFSLFYALVVFKDQNYKEIIFQENTDPGSCIKFKFYNQVSTQSYSMYDVVGSVNYILLGEISVTCRLFKRENVCWTVGFFNLMPRNLH